MEIRHLNWNAESQTQLPPAPPAWRGIGMMNCAQPPIQYVLQTAERNSASRRLLNSPTWTTLDPKLCMCISHAHLREYLLFQNIFFIMLHTFGVQDVGWGFASSTKLCTPCGVQEERRLSQGLRALVITNDNVIIHVCEHNLIRIFKRSTIIQKQIHIARRIGVRSLVEPYIRTFSTLKGCNHSLRNNILCDCIKL